MRRIDELHGHIGSESPATMGAAWGGAQVFDWYGVGDTGAIAGEGPDHAGLYVHEDAHLLEILDIEDGAPVADGKEGDMVKLRGINIYPTGIGADLTENHDDLLSEYVCEVNRKDGRDEMVVHIEARGDLDRDTSEYEKLLRARFGVEIGLKLAARGALASLTQIEVRQKPIRLIDNRKDEA